MPKICGINKERLHIYTKTKKNQQRKKGMSFDQIEFKTQNSFEYLAELAIILPKFSTDFFQLDSFSERSQVLKRVLV